MAGVLRSPQFSEQETAWLPPWLQPHRPRHVDDPFDLSSPLETDEISASYEEKLNGIEASHLVTEVGCTHSSFRLFLSGESSSSHGSMLSPKNVTDLDLHLSSEGISQIPSDLPCSYNQLRINALTKVSASESISAIPLVPSGGCQGGMGDNTCKETFLARKYPSAPRTPKEEHADDISGFWSKAEHCDGVNDGPRRRRSKGKLKPLVRTSSDTIQLKKQKDKSSRRPQLNVTDVDEAVELCIAASEAVVISELTSSSSEFELSPAKSIVGVALQVKHARKQCHLEVQASTSNRFQETDETNQLSDLDDHDMEKAFDDVGIAVTQVISAPSVVGDTCSHRTCRDNRLPSALLDTDCRGKKNPTEACFSISDCSGRKPQIVQKKDETFKVGNDAMVGDKNIKKRIANLFVAETSIFSESINTIGKSTSAQLETEPMIVPSSAKMSEDAHGSPAKRSKRTSNMEIILSQDFVDSSNFSPIDPLCSVVPCSFPLDGSFVCDRETIGKATKDVEPVSPCIQFPNSDGKTAIIEENSLVLPSFAKIGDPSTSKFQADLSGVAIRWLNSLRAYSMVVPTLDTNLSAGIGYLEKKPSDPTLFHNMTSATDRLPHKQSSCEVGEKETGFINMVCAKDGSGHGFHRNGEQMPTSPNAECISTTIDAACFTDLANQNDERCGPPILHNKSHHSTKLCSTTITEQKSVIFKGSSVSKSKRNTMDGSEVAPCRDGAVVKSCLACHSNPRSLSRKELNVEDKRVHFSVSEPSKNQIAGSLDSHGQQNGMNIRRCKKKVSRRQLVIMKGIESLTNLDINDGNELIFYGLEFLVTGFTRQEKIEVENIIRMYGGVVLPRIPRLSNLGQKRRLQRANQHYQIVISPKKVQTVVFLYGCAIKTWILNATWLSDSVKAGVLLPTGKYLILSNPDSHVKNLEIVQVWPNLSKEDYIFNKLGVMLHGKASFCSKYSTIIKHGGGQVFRSLQSLIQSLKGKTAIGAVIVEDDNAVSRHLKHCALEHNLQTLEEGNFSLWRTFLRSQFIVLGSIKISIKWKFHYLLANVIGKKWCLLRTLDPRPFSCEEESVNWIINSLFSGKLLPLKKDRSSPFHRIKMPTFPSAREMEMSEEI